MKKIRTSLLSIVLIFLGFTASAVSTDMSVLVVEDNTNVRVDSITMAIDSCGYSYTVYDATTNPAPSLEELSPYDLVLWYTSTSSGSLKLWDGDTNGEETINSAIKSYLDDGGMLWIVGTDFLYDMYGGAPDVFAAGDFVYDYLGIASYDSQSYADDGSLGVTELNAISENGINTVSIASWNYSAMNYVDAMTPTATATAVYEMGPSDYALAGGVASIYNEKGDAKTLIFTADLALVNGFDNIMKPLFQETLDYFAQYAKSDVLPTSITISSEGDATTVTVSEGELQMSVAVLPDETTNKLVNWSIKDGSAYASITKDGLLMTSGVPSGNGLVTVVATSQADESITDEFDVTVSGQNLQDFSVLLVNDNAYGVDRYLEIDTSLSNSGHDYRIYNMNTVSEVPSVEFLSNFDVVIWYTGNDGADLYLWDTSDTSNYKFNSPLIEYLDLGGCVWVQGLDFFYDVYGGTYDLVSEEIKSFEAGSFVYDYMGIKTYVAQSHADDAVTDGTPQLDITEENTMTYLDPVLWEYTTMWYVDALAITESATPLYYLGDMTYDFSLYYAAVYNKKDNGTVITYTFETARLDSEASTDALIDEMLDYLKVNLDGISTIRQTRELVDSYLYPNPAKSLVNIEVKNMASQTIDFALYDLQGRQLINSQINTADGFIKYDVSHLSPGAYIYKLEFDTKTSQGSFIVE